MSDPSQPQAQWSFLHDSIKTAISKPGPHPVVILHIRPKLTPCQAQWLFSMSDPSWPQANAVVILHVTPKLAPGPVVHVGPTLASGQLVIPHIYQIYAGPYAQWSFSMSDHAKLANKPSRHFPYQTKLNHIANTQVDFLLVVTDSIRTLHLAVGLPSECKYNYAILPTR